MDASKSEPYVSTRVVMQDSWRHLSWTWNKAGISRLPFDIFQIIVTIRWKEEGEKFAILASHVCRTWRTYVLSMSLLWDRLEFVGAVPRWDMLEAKLGRSGNALLEIKLGEDPFAKSSLPNLRRIMRMIVPHVSRWRSLRLENVPHKIRRILLDRLRAHSAPRLERLEVVQHSKLSRSPHQRILTTARLWDARPILSNLPSLRRIEWTNPGAGLGVYTTFRNLISLTIGPGTLDITSRTLIQFIHQLLSQSPFLEILVIAHGPDNSEYTLPEENTESFVVPPPITHHSLRVLDIDTTVHVRSAVVRTLALPRSQRFSRIYNDGVIDLQSFDTIAKFNTLSQLRVVSIAENATSFPLEPDPAQNIHVTCLPSAFPALESLKILAFSEIDFVDGKWLPDLGRCCPQLKWWFLERCRGYTVASIQLMIEARLDDEGMNPVEVLQIDPRWDTPPECKPTPEQISWFWEFLTFKTTNDSWLEGSDIHPDADDTYVESC